MIINVHLLAYLEKPIIRNVTIPDGTPREFILDQTFKYGQNDFQEQELPSVSIGDVIEFRHYELEHFGYDVIYYLVLPLGFKKIDREQLAAIYSEKREDRYMLTYQIYSAK